MLLEVCNLCLGFHIGKQGPSLEDCRKIQEHGILFVEACMRKTLSLWVACSWVLEEHIPNQEPRNNYRWANCTSLRLEADWSRRWPFFVRGESSRWLAVRR